ncbi:MAG: hypothetical protein WDM78_11830 [Puia sp.]
MDFCYVLFLHWSFPGAGIWKKLIKTSAPGPAGGRIGAALYVAGGSFDYPYAPVHDLKQFTDGLEYTKTAMMLSLAAMPINIFLKLVTHLWPLGISQA